jgi:hypothetical protein
MSAFERDRYAIVDQYAVAKSTRHCLCGHCVMVEWRSFSIKVRGMFLSSAQFKHRTIAPESDMVTNNIIE